MAEYVPVVTTLNVNNMFNIAWEIVQDKKLIYLPINDKRVDALIPLLHEMFQSPFLAIKTDNGYYLSFSTITKTLCLLYKRLVISVDDWRRKNVSTRKMFFKIIETLNKEMPKEAPIMINNTLPMIFALNTKEELEDEIKAKGVKKRWGYLTPAQ